MKSRNKKIQAVIDWCIEKGYEVSNYQGKKHIFCFKIPQYLNDMVVNKDWLTYRNRFVGSSEIAMAMGKSNYKSKMRLYHNKIGSFPDLFTGNVYTYNGIMMEPVVADLWSHWEPGMEAEYWAEYLKNKDRPEAEKERRRKFLPCGYYMVNEKYPDISVSIDRFIPKGEFSYFNGVKFEEQSPLELKTANIFTAKKFVNDIPLQYYVQIQSQLLVSEADEGEFALLKGGLELQVSPVKYDETVCAYMLKDCQDMMQRIRMGSTGMKHLQTSPNKAWTIINAFEPEPDGSMDCSKFLREKRNLMGEVVKEESVGISNKQNEKWADAYRYFHHLELVGKKGKELYKSSFLRQYPNEGYVQLDGKNKVSLSGRFGVKLTKEREDKVIKKLNSIPFAYEAE